MYGSIRHILHKDRYGALHRLEIQELGYQGSSSKMRARGFSFDHDEFLSGSDSILKVYENVIQKGTLNAHPFIENTADDTLIRSMFEEDEDEYRLVWKIDGQVFWKGSILNDLLEVPEEPYPYSATITAKDLSRTKGMEYELRSGRMSLIAVLADLLSRLEYGLNIHTATSWSEKDIDENVDFLQQIYLDTYALRQYGASGEEPERITVYDAIHQVLSDHGLILRQMGGVWRIEQVSAYKDPSSVLITVYDPDGDQISAATEDRQLDAAAENIIVKSEGSKTKGYPAIKQARVRFDHRTTVSNLQFPDRITLTENDPIYSASQVFSSTGNTRIHFGSTNIQAEFLDNSITEASMEVILSAMGLYWNDDTGQWQSSFHSNTVEMIL